MFAFKEEYPMSAMAMMAMADVAVPFYQPIIGRKRHVKGYEAAARRCEPVVQCYQGIDFASLSQDESLHLDIVMLRAILRDLPVLAQKGPYTLSINLNPAPSSPTYQNLLLLVLIQARKVGIERSGDSTAGNFMTKVAPRPRPSLWAEMVPPCRSTKLRTMANPRPKPPC